MLDLRLYEKTTVVYVEHTPIVVRKVPTKNDPSRSLIFVIVTQEDKHSVFRLREEETAEILPGFFVKFFWHQAHKQYVLGLGYVPDPANPPPRKAVYFLTQIFKVLQEKGQPVDSPTATHLDFADIDFSGPNPKQEKL